MLNGPVGIYKVTEEVAAQGLITLINFTAILSVNLGIMNLLPIPALDGGRHPCSSSMKASSGNR